MKEGKSVPSFARVFAHESNKQLTNHRAPPQEAAEKATPTWDATVGRASHKKVQEVRPKLHKESANAHGQWMGRN